MEKTFLNRAVYLDMSVSAVSTIAAMLRYRPSSVGPFLSGHSTAVVCERNRNFILVRTVLMRCIEVQNLSNTDDGH